MAAAHDGTVLPGHQLHEDVGDMGGENREVERFEKAVEPDEPGFMETRALDRQQGGDPLARETNEESRRLAGLVDGPRGEHGIRLMGALRFHGNGRPSRRPVKRLA